MLYALFDNKKIEPKPKLKASCICCENEVISKCGELKLWHWAHTLENKCDDWYEPETDWHRDWKKIFGKDNTEVIISKDNIKHIADIFTDEKIVIELQNSPISTKTIKSREEFYGEKMIWIINAYPFLLRFYISRTDPNYNTVNPRNLFFSEVLLPSPGWFLDFEDIVPEDNFLELLKLFGFIYKPEVNKYFKIEREDYKFKSSFIQRIKKFNAENYITKKNERLMYYIWDYPWKSWTEAKNPTFIDYDKENLFFVKEGLGTRNGNGVIISKKNFIAKYNLKKK